MQDPIDKGISREAMRANRIWPDRQLCPEPTDPHDDEQDQPQHGEEK